MVEVLREVRRVLRDDGTLWLNMGDSYASGKGTCYNPGGGKDSLGQYRKEMGAHPLDRGNKSTLTEQGLKPKDLVGIPWRLAFALQTDGWYLRSDIIWSKPNPMPESVTDRPTRNHEYIFLLTKQAQYFYDAEAIKEPGLTMILPWEERKARGEPMRHGISNNVPALNRKTDKQRGHSRRHAGFNDRWDAMTKEEQGSMMRNKRSVWIIATQSYKEAHFATFPENLVKPCILAGCPEGGTVLDPFAGSGTVGKVAEDLGRNSILIELNPKYIKLIEKRTAQQNMFLELLCP